MKQCLILGGGSKFGKHITNKLVESGYHVRLVTSSPASWSDVKNVTTIPVNWHHLAISNIREIIRDIPDLDLIFFNQNSSALSEKNFNIGNIQSATSWSQSYFVACQLPFYLVHSLKHKISHAKIGWMLSGLIKNPVDSQIGHADYIGNKFTNACILRSFSLTKQGCFFGIHPDGIIDNQDSIVKANNIVNFIEDSSRDQLNGNIFSHSGVKLSLVDQ